MAAEWRWERKAEKTGARRVCARVYEELDDLRAEIEATCEWEEEFHVGTALAQLRERFIQVLPFDPEDRNCKPYC